MGPLPSLRVVEMLVRRLHSVSWDVTLDNVPWSWLKKVESVTQESIYTYSFSLYFICFGRIFCTFSRRLPSAFFCPLIQFSSSLFTFVIEIGACLLFLPCLRRLNLSTRPARATGESFKRERAAFRSMERW